MRKFYLQTFPHRFSKGAYQCVPPDFGQIYRPCHKYTSYMRYGTNKSKNRFNISWTGFFETARTDKCIVKYIIYKRITCLKRRPYNPVEKLPDRKPPAKNSRVNQNADYNQQRKDRRGAEYKSVKHLYRYFAFII